MLRLTGSAILTMLHISLNIASDSSAAVDMSNVVNTALHVSLNKLPAALLT